VLANFSPTPASAEGLGEFLMTSRLTRPVGADFPDSLSTTTQSADRDFTPALAEVPQKTTRVR
jgi:hypothetical protein